MADEGRVQNQEDLQRKISTLRREVLTFSFHRCIAICSCDYCSHLSQLVTLEVLHQELSSVGKNSVSRTNCNSMLYLFYQGTTVEPRYFEVPRDMKINSKKRGFEILNRVSTKWRSNEGESAWLRNSGDFELTEFEIARFDRIRRLATKSFRYE